MSETFQVDLSAGGVFAVAWSRRGPVLFNRVGKKLGKEIMTEWATRKRLPGLGGHFLPQHAPTLGFSPRAAKYDRRKERKFGRVPPYVSPSKHPLGGSHVKDLVHHPGSGFRIKSIRGETLQIQLTIPGARKLNLARSRRGQVYRKEFLRLKHPIYGKPDRDWLLGEFNKRFWMEFNAVMEKEQRVVLKSRSRLNTRLQGIAS